MAGYFGDDLAAGERLLAPPCQFGPPLVDTIRPMAYPDFLALLDPIAPNGRNYYEPAYSVRQFSDVGLDTLITWAGRMPPPFSAVLIHHIHGAATRVAPGAAAFACASRTTSFMTPPGKKGRPKRTLFGRGLRLPPCNPLPCPVSTSILRRRAGGSGSRLVRGQLRPAGRPKTPV